MDMFHLIEVEIYCRHLTMDGYISSDIRQKLDMFHPIKVEIYCRHLTMDGYISSDIWQKLEIFHLIKVKIYCRHLTMDGYVCLLSKKEAGTRRQQLWLIWQKAVTEQTMQKKGHTSLWCHSSVGLLDEIYNDSVS